ncbi:CPCC family cysteine-rich protein [Streptomyces sp. NPDC047990]|uniref:CPCC family cysteine-rich protein n=1 Tax=Streptomyces sp. NPDC047990 TaxID=3365496 RepID=UPI00372424E6
MPSNARSRGSYKICPVCFWEHDGQDEQDANRVWGGPSGRLSLTAACRNFHAV